MERQKKISQTLKGVTINDSKDKTVKVLISSVKVHPLYRKRYLCRRKFLAHTEQDIKKGQKVVLAKIRPLSRHKAWKVVEVE